MRYRFNHKLMTTQASAASKKDNVYGSETRVVELYSVRVERIDVFIVKLTRSLSKHSFLTPVSYEPLV